MLIDEQVDSVIVLMVVTAVVSYGLISSLGALGCALLLGRLGATEAEGVTDATPH